MNLSKIKSVLTLATLVAAASGMPNLHAQDHGHLNAGAVSWDQGSKLRFDNGADFSQSVGYVKTLLALPTGKYVGFYDGNITLTALHSVNGFGDPVAGSPAPGSFLIARIVSVEGPAGGSFQFWETNSVAGAPTFSVPSGSQPAGVAWELSDKVLGAGDPGGDPFGHIHGRRFSASKPGIYTVGFVVIDTSTNGVPSGPIHQPSDPFYMDFQAGYNIKQITWANGVANVTVGTQVGFVFTLQYKTDLKQSNWTDVDQVAGNDNFQTIIDPTAGDAARFYRIVVTAATP